MTATGARTFDAAAHDCYRCKSFWYSYSGRLQMQELLMQLLRAATGARTFGAAAQDGYRCKSF